MKLKNLRAILLLTALTVFITGAAWAGNGNNCTGGSDNATWSANGSSSISINVGSTGELDVNMASPMCLNTYPNFPNTTLPVYTDVGLDSSTCPDGTSGTEATCPLTPPSATLSGNPQDYSSFGQTQTYDVNFDATDASPGTYTFHVHANASDPDQTHDNGNNLDGYGWGYGGGVELTVTVTQPQPTCVTTDTLNVVISKPVGGNVNFCNGGTSIPVSISASDTSNKITSLTASVNNVDITGSLAVSGADGTQLSASATGTYTAGGVGAYVFDAAAATACTTGSASATVDLIYVLSGLDSPLGGSNPKAGNKVPIQFTPTDCKGNSVPQDNTVEVKVYNGSTLLEDSTPGGCTGTNCGTGTSSDVSWTATTGQYHTNFTSPATAGTFTVDIYFGGVKNYETTFTTK